MTSKVIVLGSSGQLGSELKKAALRRPTPSIELMFVDRTHYTIDGSLRIRDFLAQERPDGIINCIAYTAVDKAEAEADLAFQLNHLLVEEIASYGEQQRAGVVHFSTDYVFDGRQSAAYCETDAVSALNVYGRSKAAGESALLSRDCTGAIFRTSWLYSNSGANFFKTVGRLASEKAELRIVADQVGTPTFAGDLADTVIKHLNELLVTPCELYHFSNEGVATWYDFATEIVKRKKLACSIVPIATKEYPAAAARPAFSVMTKEKIKAKLSLSIDQWGTALGRCLDEI